MSAASPHDDDVWGGKKYAQGQRLGGQSSRDETTDVLNGRLFGTDGVRGVANVDLTPELAMRLGRAAAAVLAGDRRGRFLIGRDTRRSGPMLEAALTAALCSAGGDVLRAGILPTPAVAYLTRRQETTAGIVISASHNPVEDNGIKFFAGDGFKLPDSVEEQIEARLDGIGSARLSPSTIGRADVLPEATDAYVEYLAEIAEAPLAGLRIVVDCAWGAAYAAAPALWQQLGATVIALHDQPDGDRINVNCGSTHPEVVQRAVLEHGADIGLAHDGDADRVIAVDERGRIIDGDVIMAVCGMHLHAHGQLPGDRIVATVMSNLGMEVALQRAGIALDRTAVGDRYVLERMRAVGATVGGEQSGHVIFLEHATTGDGLLTAVQLINVMLATDQRLSDLAAPIERYPQVLHNVAVTDRDGAARHAKVQQAIVDAEKMLGNRGRVLVRPSGTEPVVRVMVEAEDLEDAQGVAYRLVEVIEQTLGRRAT